MQELTGRRYMGESEGAANFLELARHTVNARRREPMLRPGVYSATLPLASSSCFASSPHSIPQHRSSGDKVWAKVAQALLSRRRQVPGECRLKPTDR